MTKLQLAAFYRFLIQPRIKAVVTEPKTLHSDIFGYTYFRVKFSEPLLGSVAYYPGNLTFYGTIPTNTDARWGRTPRNLCGEPTRLFATVCALMANQAPVVFKRLLCD